MLLCKRILAIALIVGLGIALLDALKRKKTYPLPPGPRGLPLVGSLTGLPPKDVHGFAHWLQYKDRYGPISSVTVLGTTYVVLHSAELAFQLLEKKSTIYSSRARSVFGGEMLGWEHTVALQPYGKQFRTYRKYVHTMIGTQATVAPYIPLQEKEVHRFLLRVLQEPENLFSNIRTQSSAIILKMIYGYNIERHGTDFLVNLIDTSSWHFSLAMAVGSWLVDSIPALRYIPEWLPGAGFKRQAKAWRTLAIEAAERPFQFARQQLRRDPSAKSYVADFGLNLSPEDSYMVQRTALSLFSGGADTTVSAVKTFYFLMTQYPEVQRKAREEIDRVVGSERLPEFSDRDYLPYVGALVKEVLRWQPVLPMGLPHATSKDDVVNGYFIPKGAVVMSNVWWMCHDPATYPKPSLFNPARFLGNNPCPDPTIHIFGYGRRICPGRYFAYSSVWLSIARSLAVFDIGKGVDENGLETEPTSFDATKIFTTGIVSHALPFNITIKPRSPHHEALIRNVEKLYPRDEDDSKKAKNIVI
ncbi:cytochrome P450 oxidoreductase OrdA-like protein [Xylaria nigripes]|nr:cytochrome P450 oxidoreductase OrdA-like protein [Xylaria nigripes]